MRRRGRWPLRGLTPSPPAWARRVIWWTQASAASGILGPMKLYYP